MPSFRNDPLVWNFTNTIWHDPILHEFGMYKYRWVDHILRFYTVKSMGGVRAFILGRPIIGKEKSISILTIGGP